MSGARSPARAVAAVGGALALSVALAAFGIALHERSRTLAAYADRGALVASVVAAQAAQTLDEVARTLDARAVALARAPADRQRADAPGVGDAAAASASGGPARGGSRVRSLLVVEAGARTGDAAFGPLPAPGAVAVGRAPPGTPADTLPLLRTTVTAGGRRLLLVALVDARRLAAHGADSGGAALSVSVGAAADAPARSARSAAGDRLVATRAVPRWPLTVVVEQDRSAALANWRELLRWLAAGAALALAAVAAMTAIAVRGCRDRDAARQAVAHRERELGIVVKSVQELLFRTDAAGRLGFVNPRWEAATGRAAAQLIGRPLAELVEPASRPALDALFATGATGARSARVVLAAAPAREFELSVSPLLDRERLVGFAGSAVDVTERSAAQRELQEQLSLSATMLDTMPLPVALLDAGGRYVAINRAWEGHAGVARAELVGRTSSAYLPPAEDALHRARTREALGGGAAVRYECESTAADGSRRTLSVTKAPVPGADGRPRGLVVTLLDISEFREADRAMRDARDIAEEASRAKSEFIANISHELRTPLQAIIGFSELGAARGRAAPKLAAMFEEVNAAGLRMLALVDDLLDVSKIESSVGTFHLERTDLRPLVREVARELAPLLASRRLSLQMRLDDAPLVAKVDPLRLQQVVRNILANAVKFSPGGAAIEVDGGVDERGQIVLAVRDRGPGIPPAELETIFEAFVQSSQTKDGSGGTGLGLAICRKIVEAHGGRVIASNADGGGSRFTIVFPARGFADTVI